jgi:tartrate dehydrogenase/decarboxylase / D-malate dehydrogenase
MRSLRLAVCSRSWWNARIESSTARLNDPRRAWCRSAPCSTLSTVTTTPTYRVAVIAGDGIGLEVVPAAFSVVDRVASRAGFRLDTDHFPWGCDYYLETGRMMAADALDTLRAYDAIFLGAVGAPGVPDHVSVWELILPIRQRFDQYVNLRPMKLLPGITSPLAGRGPDDIDMICVRENSEGEYAGLGGRLHVGTPHEVAEQTGIFTRRGIERIVRYAFDLAASRPRRLLASATKSNALQHSMVLWDEVVESVARDYPTVDWRKYHADALAARMVTHPHTLDVIVGSNLFGDIITDLGAAISGSLGVAPGANINPERTAPSMFEPIHGSAPDIAGRGIANPVASIWAAALMLDHLGEPEAARQILEAIASVLTAGEVRTPDLGGTATTLEVAAAVAEAVGGGGGG